jgi:6-pyruvoyltetrahydropterin/6-carboxytetrahydropterin synthase
MSDRQLARVTKQFTFEMAHALYGYDGPCKNIHGHTYHLEVTLRGEPLDDATHVKNGMVVDFSVIKQIVMEEVVSIYDHALVLNEDAPYVKSDLLTTEFEKVFTVPFQPTCENLMLYFMRKLQPRIPERLTLVSVVLRETPTSFAEWRLEDNL